MTRIPLEGKSILSWKSRGFNGRQSRKSPTRKREEPYFGYLAPMLLQLKTGRVAGYQEGQSPLLYLVSTV